MIKLKNVAIIGSGSWGTALAIALAKNGNKVKIWSYNAEEARLINEEKKCKFLPNVTIPENIDCLTDFEEVIKNSDFILHVTPSKFTRETFKKYKQYVGKKPVIICSKGFEEGTLKTLDEVLKDELPEVRVGVLTGPSHAEEVSIGIPTALVIASKYEDVRELVKDTFINESLRIYTSDDIKGAELRWSIEKYYGTLCRCCNWIKLRRQYIRSSSY